MRLTIVNQFYTPDISPTARLAQSLAEYRANAGDEVTVVASLGYASTDDERTAISAKIRLQRVWTPKLGKKNALRRCIDYLVFFMLASWRLVRLKRQDVVISLTTPPFIVFAGVFHKVLHPRTRLILWNMDCYPEVIERVGLKTRHSVAIRLLRRLDRGLMRRIDHVVCLDAAMQALVSARHPKSKRRPATSVIPNWAPLGHFPFQPAYPVVRALLPVATDQFGDGGRADIAARSDAATGETDSRTPAANETGRSVHPADRAEFVVAYTGNLGYGHCFETLIDAAEQLGTQNKAIRFVLTGGGVRTIALQQAKQQRSIQNMTHRGYVSEEELRRIRERAGCVVITLRDEMLGVMSPSKLYASLAMGLPILYVGPGGSNVDDAIQRYRCGISLRHGDVDGFVEFVRLLSNDPTVRAAYSQRARQAFEAEYCDQRALPKFDQVIRSVFDRSDRRAA